MHTVCIHRKGIKKPQRPYGNNVPAALAFKKKKIGLVGTLAPKLTLILLGINLGKIRMPQNPLRLSYDWYSLPSDNQMTTHHREGSSYLRPLPDQY